MDQVATTVGEATTSAYTTTTEMFKCIAYYTPGLKSTVVDMVHSGFWDSYECTREFVHRTVRSQLIESPTSIVYCTGHSLGIL